MLFADKAMKANYSISPEEKANCDWCDCGAMAAEMEAISETNSLDCCQFLETR